MNLSYYGGSLIAQSAIVPSIIIENIDKVVVKLFVCYYFFSSQGEEMGRVGSHELPLCV